MSNALAIAGVTAVLRDLLNNGFVDGDISGILSSNVEVSALPPDRILSNGGLDQPQLNIYMYLATPNTGWRNECLPSRNATGQSISNPPLALDLHYLLTAYGVADLDAEILLGYAMHLLHESPVLERSDIESALDQLVAPLDDLSESGLADQMEKIKFTPEYLNTEEMSKLWTAVQSNYRPTAAYQASVVLIESEQPVHTPLPVRERLLHVMPFQRPDIDQLSPERITVGELLTIEGTGLAGDVTRLRFANGVRDPDSVTNAQITFTVDASLSAGIQSVQVVHEIELGDPPESRLGTDSNIVPFILLPTIENPMPINVAAGNTLSLNITPPVESDQNASIMLGATEINIPPRGENDPPAVQLGFPIPEGLPTGDYLLRLRVDGAQSELTVDETTGEYDGPVVTVT